MAEEAVLDGAELALVEDVLLRHVEVPWEDLGEAPSLEDLVGVILSLYHHRCTCIHITMHTRTNV